MSVAISSAQTSPSASSPALRRHAWRLCGTVLAILAGVGACAALGLTQALDTWLRVDIYGVPAAVQTSWLGHAVRAMVLVAAALLLVPLLLRMHGFRVLATALAVAGVAVALDHALLTGLGVAWGAAGLLLVVAFGAVASWLMERRRALSGVQRLEAWLQERISQMSCNNGEFARESLFRDHFAELCRTYLDCRGAVLAVLPPGRWHLDLRGFYRVQEGDVAELRRDIRRSPYHEVFATGRPAWCDGFLSSESGLRSLLVPLVGRDRPVGLWVVHVPVGETLDDVAWLVVERLAEYFRLCLQPPPAAMPSTPRPLLERLLAPDRALPEVASIAHLSQVVATGHRWLLALLDDAPVGVLAAGLWGDVLYANGAMRKALSRTGEPRHLTQVLMALTSLPRATVMERLRDVVAEGRPWQFDAGQPSAAFALARWAPSGAGPGDEAVPWRLVLTAVPRSPLPSPQPVDEGDPADQGVVVAL